ncbi:MAG: peptidoglycan recognition family protein [Myxococcota bacterium]
MDCSDVCPPFDVLPRCAQLQSNRSRQDISSVVVHRIEVSQEDPSFCDTPEDVERFFCEHPVGVKATGGAMPYALLISTDGRITQSAPLCRITPHAAFHNPKSIGVGCLGDFRHAPPSGDQGYALELLCAFLLRELDLGIGGLHGHDELTGGSREIDKVCPGVHLPMGDLRSKVAVRLIDGLVVRFPAVFETEPSSTL